MTPEDAIDELEAAWAEPAGVLYQLRQGALNADGMADLVALLGTIEVGADASSLPRRFVSLLWYVPLFVCWQKERVQQNGGNADAVARFAGEITNDVERVLGVP